MFGPSVTSLDYSTLTNTTQVPCSKNGTTDRNQANLWEMTMRGLQLPAAGSGAGTDYGFKGQNAGSGNSAGGSFVIEPGAKSGSGADGRVKIRQPGGVPDTDELQFYDDGTRSWIETKQTDLRIRVSGYIAGRDITFGSADGGNPSIYVTAGTLQVGVGSNAAFGPGLFSNSGTGATIFGGNYDVGWNSTPAGNNPDSCIGRASAGVLRLTDAAGNTPTWLQQTAARAILGTAYTNATTTFSSISGLAIPAPLVAGRKYAGWLELTVNQALAADGFKLDFNGGSATMTSVNFGIESVLGGALGTRTSTALNSAVTITALADTSDVVISVMFGCVCNAGGTLIPRAAKNADAAGATMTVRVNSFFWLDDMP